MSSPEAVPLTRPPRTEHFSFLVLLGGPALLFVLIVALGYRYSKGSPNQNVTMGDRQYLIAVPELLDATKNTGGYNPKEEVLRKVKLPRGGRELEYRYSGAKPDWQIAGRVIAEIDPMQARATFTQFAERELASPGITLAPLSMTWGEEALMGALQRNGETVGHYFLGRKGNRVVLYRIEGVVLPAPMTFEEFIKPRLALAETFEP